MPSSPNLFLSVFPPFALHATPTFNNSWQFGGKFCILHKLSFEYVLLSPSFPTVFSASKEHGRQICLHLIFCHQKYKLLFEKIAFFLFKNPEKWLILYVLSSLSLRFLFPSPFHTTILCISVSHIKKSKNRVLQNNIVCFSI